MNWMVLLQQAFALSNIPASWKYLYSKKITKSY